MTQLPRPATMRDVAERAGVSRSLVSTVFRDVPGASPATRERILAAAAELGFRPDERARNLRSRERRVIGVTLTAVHPFHVQVVEALHDATALRGYELSLGLSTQTRTLERAVDTLLAQRCAAVILVGPTEPDEELAALVDVADGIPFVAVDRHTTVETLDAVRVDDAAALREVVGHLAGLGHREIWHLDGGPFVSALPRREGYLSAMAAHGLADRARVIPGGGRSMDGARAAMDLVAGTDMPTAIAVYNDRAAMGLIDILWRNQVAVPQDVSVVGFDNIEEAGMPNMKLTTIEQSASALAEHAVDLLLGRLSGARAGGLHLLPPGPLVVRGSTARPRIRRPLGVRAG